MAPQKIQFRSTFNIRHPQKVCGTEENDLRRKNRECFKKRFCLVMMVTQQESDEVEQITKSSHRKANFYFFRKRYKKKLQNLDDIYFI